MNRTNFRFVNLQEDADHVLLVHDAVRPLVEPDLVEELIKNALAYGVIHSDEMQDRDLFLDFATLRYIEELMSYK